MPIRCLQKNRKKAPLIYGGDESQQSAIRKGSPPSQGGVRGGISSATSGENPTPPNLPLARGGTEKQSAIRLLKLLLIFSFPIMVGCGLSQDRVTIDQYNQFAIRSAQSKLWNEAVFRWKQILEIDPQNAKVHNNLGVAYEALGKIDEAIEFYKQATELDPTNKFYRFNYRKCRLHVQRNSRKPPARKGEKTDSPS